MGLAALDTVMSFDRPLSHGGKNEARDVQVLPGGQAVVAAAAAAALGGRSAFAGRVGAGGGAILEALRLRGVDVALAEEVPGPTQTALILVEPTGERTIGWIRPPGVRIPRERVSREAIGRSAVLLLDGHQGEADIAAAETARAAGTRVVLDLEDLVPETPRLLALAQVAICDRRFLLDFSRREPSIEALHPLLDAGPALVAVSLGAQGVLGLTAAGAYEAPAPRVSVRDTTGAGDVLHGAFALALARGLAPDEALSFAASAAALATRGVGTMGSLPSWREAAEAAVAVRVASGRRPPSDVGAPAPDDLPNLGPERSRRRRVLLVDDNPIVHHTLGRLLSSHGYLVVSARTGAEAIERFAEGRPDVVIMDIRLPDTSGLMAIAALKEKIQNCPPILVHTGYSDDFSAGMTREKGADAYLAKPAAPDEVIRAIEGLLKEKG